jgi:phosphoribosylformylglycinamidine synthase
MATPNVLVLRAAGTNCDLETQHAWELAGARAQRVHLRRVIESPNTLDDYQIITIPGGFSYGDDISAGRIFAAQIERHLTDHLKNLTDSGRLVLGICNGFQILVKAGLLPDPHSGDTASPTPTNGRVCTIAENDPPGFQDRWVRLQAGDTPCVFIEPGHVYEMPIAHGEGRVLFKNGWCLRSVVENHQNALAYVPDSIQPGDPPSDIDGLLWLGTGAPNTDSETAYNPNGSEADIAGLCDPTGRVLGLMPHPERFVTWTQHPGWTSQPERPQGDGLAMFQRAVAYFE